MLLDAVVYCAYVRTSIWPLRCQGPHLFVPVYIMCTVWLGVKMAAARESFKFSQRSASNDHYIAWNASSSPTLPTINDICCEIGNMSDYYSCTVYALQFQDTHQRGWLKHGNMVQIALACRHSRQRVSCIHGARVAAKHCVIRRPWLQSLLIASTASARAMLS